MGWPRRRAPGEVTTVEADRRQVTLGMTDRIVFGAASMLLIGLIGWGWTAMQGALASLTLATQKNTITIAVMSSQLDALNTQLADIPNLKDRLNDVENRVDRNTDELRRMRGGQ